MKKLTGVIITALLLTGCSQGEPVELKMPYNVEMARESCITEAKVVEPLEKVAETVPESRNYDVAPAVIATPAPTPAPPTQTPTPEPETPTDAILTPLEPIVEVVEVIPEPEPCIEYPEAETGNYYEDLPDETSEVWQYEEPAPTEPEMQHLGVYYITHYSAEACGNAIGAAEVPGGLVEGTSIAVPEYWMLGHWFYIENHGTFRADDISDGPFDIFHWYTADAVGADYQNVYLVG